jgi:hypothetical protein
VVLVMVVIVMVTVIVVVVVVPSVCLDVPIAMPEAAVRSDDAAASVSTAATAFCFILTL